MAKIEDVNAKLNYLEITKALIKEAIENKGQEIEDSDTFREFVNKISNIQTKSIFRQVGAGGFNSNCSVGDTISFGANADYEYTIGDFVPLDLEKSKSSGKYSGRQYIYRYGVGEVTDIEIISSSTKMIYMKIIYLFQHSFPEFISESDGNGIKYYNSATSVEQNWYSYNYSDLDVTADDVIVNKKFLGASGIETGTIQDNGALNYTPSDEVQVIPEGYTTGGTIDAIDITTTDDYDRCLNISKSILGIE